MLLQIEAAIVLLCLGYFLFYISDRIYHGYNRVKDIITPGKTSIPIEEQQKIIIEKDEQPTSIKVEVKKDKNLSEEDKVRLIDIVKKVKLNTIKGYNEQAKTLIVEGLTIDKYHQELNLELAGIYESEKNYKNAEYIYRDLMNIHASNVEIVKKLGYILALQKKYEDSISIYEIAFAKTPADMEVVEVLTDLHYEVGNYEQTMKYLILSLKEKPRNVERLLLKANLLKKEEKLEQALKVYKEILEIQPYNTEAFDNVRNIERRTVG